MNNNGQDGRSFPHNNTLNGNFNGIFPQFSMPMPFFPHLQHQQQNFEDQLMDDFNHHQLNQLSYGGNMTAGGVNINHQYSPQQPGLAAGITGGQGAASPPDPPQRAAELRLKLIASMAERKNSATPPNNSSNSSPNIPYPNRQLQPAQKALTDHSTPGDTDLDDLLREGRSAAESSAAKASSHLHIKTENASVNNRLQTPIKTPTTPAFNGSSATERSSPIMNKSTRRTSEKIVQAAAEMSDGEIPDDPKPNRRPLPPTGPKESELSVVKRKQAEDQAGRERKDEKQSENETATDANVHHSPLKVYDRSEASRSRNDRNDAPDPRRGGVSERQPQPQPRMEQKRYERREENQREDRGRAEMINKGNQRADGGRTETTNKTNQQADRGRTEFNNKPSQNADRGRSDLIEHNAKPRPVHQKSQSPQAETPETRLQRVLAENETLRLWLDLTGYNEATREAKLGKYREYLAMSQRQKQLAAELGGMGFLELQAQAETPQLTNAAMPPPPTPTKVNEEKTMVTRRNENTNTTSEVLGKRGREIDDTGKDSTEKYPRTDSEGRGLKIKGEGSNEHQRDNPRRSFGESDGGSRFKQEEQGRRRSPSPNYNRPDSRDSYGGRGRGRDYDRSQDYDMSGSRAFENRPPARSISRDRGPDNDDWKSRRLNEPLESDYGEYRGDGRGGRGGYQGKNYDPNFNESRGRGVSAGRARGGGRGGGRGDYYNDAPPRTYGNGSAMKPRGYKETWDRGGKGDTRFFILKSFNEENILHCQKDSIWTTQEHNAEMLVDAFNSCKNVIFCFSINSSKHFQGYARMESLPGSEPSPIWQNKIRFPTAGAFRIKWLTVANTHFTRVGHLKNSLNEGNKVYVGKDGQEIEEEAGRELVNIIDEEFEHRCRGVFEDNHSNEGGPGPMIKSERGGFQMGRGDGFMGRGDGRGYRTYRNPGSEVGEIRWL